VKAVQRIGQVGGRDLDLTDEGQLACLVVTGYIQAAGAARAGR
jgi:hypothetical protein